MNFEDVLEPGFHDRFLLTALKLFIELEVMETLFWYLDDTGCVWPSVLCNDIFQYSCSDIEQIFPYDLPLFEKSVREVQSLRNGYGSSDGALLWACRKRKKIPMERVGQYTVRAVYDLMLAAKDFAL